MASPSKLRPHSPRHPHQKGWGLTETLLTLGAISAMSVAIYMVLKPADASAQVKVEQDNLRALSRSIDQSMGILGSFQGLDADVVLSDDLAPSRMRSSGGLRTEWGAAVDLRPHRVHQPNDSFVVTYLNTPTEVCAGLASAMARDAYDIRVGGSTVFDSAGGVLDPGLAAQRCSADDATMEFVFHSGLVSGQAVAAPTIELPPPNPTITNPATPPPVIVIPPSQPVDSVGPGSPAMPPTAPPPPVTPPPVAPPPSTPPPTPTPVPTTPPLPPPDVVAPGVMCSVPASWVNYENRTPNCAVNQFGVRTQRRSQDVSYSCPEAWAPREEHRTAWSSWSDTSNTCASCAPTTGTRLNWQSRSANCPSGQFGTNTWEEQRNQSRTGTYNCPAGTTSLPSPNWGSWVNGTWTGNTRSVSNTCASCAPITGTRLQWQSRSASCPSGQLGSRTWEEQRNQSRTGTYSCPAGTTSLPSPSWGDWVNGTWTGNTRNVNNTCSAVCEVPNPATQTQTQTRTGERTQSCPSGQSGNIFQERDERRTRTRTASCPAPTGSHTWSAWTSWSGWSGTSSWSTVSNTCSTSPGSCGQWVRRVYSLAPNFGNLDGETVNYNDGAGGGCSASWGGRGGSGSGSQAEFNACRSSIPNQPPRVGASYSLSEYTNWGGGMENYFEYAAPDVCPTYKVISSDNCDQDSLCAPPGVWPSTWKDRAQSACAGAPAGTAPGNIDYCHQPYIMCTAIVECTGN